MPSKPPSWEHIRAAANAFVAEWQGEARERAEAQSFWNDWFEVFGIKRRRVATFEAAASRLTTGGAGAIDVLWPGHIAVEHKSAGKDLEAAVDQALDYLVGLDATLLPRLVISCDFARFLVHDLETGERWDFTLHEFPLVIERFGFLAGYQQREFDEEPEANVAAAELMASLFDSLDDGRYPRHELRLLLTRLLFMLFGDDTGIWEKGLFQEFLINRTVQDGTDLGPQLIALFDVLNTPEGERPDALPEDLEQFPHINGHLFEERIRPPYFTEEARNCMLACCHFDWSAISPAVFGSMFQSVMTADERRHIGAHYTSERNILKLIRPLFLDEYRARFERGNSSVRQLRALRQELGTLRFLDPACGCGNFLIIAYRELRRLEFDILVRLRELDTGSRQTTLDAAHLTVLDIDQFFGIEVEEFPARIAEVAMYLVDHLENMRLSREFGLLFMRFPIRTSATIRVENACRLDWRSVLPADQCTHLLGNPPFVGMSLMTAEQQEDKLLVFEKHVGAKRTGRLDYVACWYAKALDYMRGTLIRAAFVSTNSITQGEQARTMGPLIADAGFKVDFAHRTFRWTSEARGKAAVHVVIVGFSASSVATSKHIYDYPDVSGDPIVVAAKSINIYLADSDVAAISKHSKPLAQVPKLTEGNRPQDGGGLLVDADEREQIAAADPIAAKYLRRLIGAQDMLNGGERWCLWLVDADPRDLHASPLLAERMGIVRDARLASPTASARDKADTPSLFLAIRQPRTRWLCVPRHSSEHRRIIPMGFFGPEDIAHDSTLTLAGADEYLFGVLQSAMFTAWAKTVSGRIKSDIRMSPDLSYNSFPFPDVDERRADAISAAADDVLGVRSRHADVSLAVLYAPSSTPPELADAHRVLDRAVDRAFGLTRPSDTERLSALFARYASLTA